MDQSDQIRTLPELALHYGTITKEQYAHVMKLLSMKTDRGNSVDFGQLLLSQRYATAYQVGLLKLIREYLIIKKKGEEFGKIAVAKGYATQVDVDHALEEQKKAFKKAKIRKLIGDILVESRVITEKQKTEILEEQTYLDNQARKILTEDTETDEKEEIPVKGPGTSEADKEIVLTKYEEHFLQIKVLDQEFAASVLEKGLATEGEVSTAQDLQERAFEKEKHIRTLGDIMVELRFITDEEKNLILEEQNRIEKKETQKKSPIAVEISEDQMEAEIHIDEEINSWVTLLDVKNAMADKGIKYGIYPDAILQCNLDIGNKKFVSAKQDFSMELIKSRKAKYLFDTSGIDPTEKKMGEALAEKGFSSDTFLKKDLFGNTVEQHREKDFTFRCGRGTRLSKDNSKVFAGKSGFPSLSIERKLFIHPKINVLEDADLRYGPLEAYANLEISGILTGAYPVTAGHVHAEEIRGARIEAIGDVTARVGITNARISAQGDIRARYLHNCRIETFGNVYIENEIIDSQIFSSGKVDCPKCHVVASAVYGKKGVELSGAGNDRAAACTIGAGTEHHILEKANQVELKIKEARKNLDELTQKKEEQAHYRKKIFQKMVEIKMFHDRAKKKKEKLTQEFKKKKNSVKRENLKNIVRLIHGFEKRMKASVASLKNHNQTKKKYEKEISALEEKIEKLKPEIKKQTQALKTDLFAFFEWARKEQSLPQIKFNKQIFSGTTLSGIFSSITIEENKNNISVIEKEISNKTYEIVIRNN